MPKPTKGPRLGGSPAHQRLILRNLATQLFEHGAISTTEKKARVLRPYAEKLITKAKKGDLHNRRLVLRELFNGVDQAALEEGVLVVNKYPQHKLFTEIAPMYADRPGGYTRITKIGPRKGDNAPMAVISLVTEAYTPSAGSSSKGNTVSSSANDGDSTPAPVPATDEPELVDEGARDEEAGAADASSDADTDGTDAVVEEASAEAEPAAGTDDPEAQAAAEDAAPTEGDKNA